MVEHLSRQELLALRCNGDLSWVQKKEKSGAFYFQKSRHFTVSRQEIRHLGPSTDQFKEIDHNKIRNAIRECSAKWNGVKPITWESPRHTVGRLQEEFTL
ncbi:hypothetical protein RUM43_011375 [Polyplax serrata]|uniref:Uncharacterized protein n=1 Tax=Polyplax serrata TaxID=468196 RepID=A0AAN8NM28_POLSC